MTYVATVLADAPEALWTLDESSGTTAADATGNGHTGTYQTSAMVGGSSWGAITTPTFNGSTNRWVSVPPSSALSTHAGLSGVWSMDGMFLDGDPTSSATRMLLSVSDFPNGYEVFISKSGGHALMEISKMAGSGYDGSVALISSSTPWPVGSGWHHVAVVYDRAASIFQWFVDGCLQDSAGLISGSSSYTGKVWRIGARGDSSGDRWLGSISHLAIYPTALTLGQIRGHVAAAGITPPCLHPPRTSVGILVARA